MNPPTSSPFLRRSLIAFVILLILAAGGWWMTRPKPIPVVFKEVGLGIVESTVSNTRAGTVEACQRTKLSTTLGGRIEVLAVKEGDKVKKGQLLLKLWNDDQQAQSALALTQVETARRRVTEVCTLAANAEREAQRQTELRAKNYVSGSREEAARAEAQAKRAACDASKSDVIQAEARVKVTRVE